jgi:hypothetical protein
MLLYQLVYAVKGPSWTRNLGALPCTLQVAAGSAPHAVSQTTSCFQPRSHGLSAPGTSVGWEIYQFVKGS